MAEQRARTRLLVPSFLVGQRTLSFKVAYMILFGSHGG
jgi:hypothetical protein